MFLCREYAPAAYPPGGIGTYVRHITRLLAEAGETVHVIAHRWDGAPRAREESVGGRLIVHRVSLDEPAPDRWAIGGHGREHLVPRGLLASAFPSQAFSWQAALLAERLVESEGIDVIEAQEWEAPLYYFQLRRSLNLGPARRPPCIVHLHSPSELIFEANDWDRTVADYRPAIALEEYSITHADAILCPSRFLAEQALARYAIDRARVNVVPYPLGQAVHVDRRPETWANGTICHVGRLELRKGVLEWADALATVAAEHPRLLLEFVGGDTPLHPTGGTTVGDEMRARIPQHLRRQLHFSGTRDRNGVMEVLATARAAVVPSRWENFPYSCIESMCSGLPVIVSPNGGMREMIEDGVSGWVAADGTPSGLAGALRRALNTPAADLARMGAAAADGIRRLCDNGTVLHRHIELKGRIAAAKAEVQARTAVSSSQTGGMGVIVSCRTEGGQLDACVAALRAQTERPAAVCIIRSSPHGGHRSAFPALDDPGGWHVLEREDKSIDEAEREAVHRLTAGDRSLVGLVFVDSRVSLEPEFLSVSQKLLDADDKVGIVSGWTHETAPRDRVRVPPSPAVPYVWHDDEMSPYLAVRTDAFTKILGSALGSPTPKTRLGILTGIMDAGWTAMTYPAVLASIVLDRRDPATRPPATRYSSMAQAIQRLHTPLLQWLLTCPPEDRRAFVRQGMKNPARSAWWLAARALQGWKGRLQGTA